MLAREFHFEDDRGFWRVDIIGGDSETTKKRMWRLQMLLIHCKVELLHATAKTVKEFKITLMEEAKKDDKS